MTIDLTLDGLKLPDINGYVPPFGTKITRTDLNKGGLSTREVSEDVLMPFSLMRPKTVEEDSVTTAVEYDAKLVFSSSLVAAASLSLGSATYEGCEVSVRNLSAFTCTVSHSQWSLSIPAGGFTRLEWNGSAWAPDTSASVVSGGILPPTSAAVQSAIEEVQPPDMFTDGTMIGQVFDTTYQDGSSEVSYTITEPGYYKLHTRLSNDSSKDTNYLHFDKSGVPVSNLQISSDYCRIYTAWCDDGRKDRLPPGRRVRGVP